MGTDGAQEHDGDKNTTPQTAFDLNDGAQGHAQRVSPLAFKGQLRGTDSSLGLIYSFCFHRTFPLLVILNPRIHESI